MLNAKIANGIIVVVTAVWVVNFAARFLDPGYKPDETINAIFMAIVGGTFALKAKKPPRDEE